MIRLLALVSLLSPAVAAPPLIYPLQAPPQITSTFGTYRINHHHAGLDLATADDRVPVIAAADGVVTRIRRNDAGFGRAIYIRHADGRQTVYAHLSGFAPKLRALVQAREARKQRFKLVFNLARPIPVKQGEQLGWVGTSGTDLIHLHFELREDGQPINPLRNGLTVPDRQPPRIARLLLVPRRLGGHVNDAVDEAVITDFSQPIRVGGDVGIWAEVNDRVDGSERDLTPYEITLEIDGKTRHKTRYDQVSYGEKRLTEFDFHLPRQAQKIGRYNALFRWGPRQRIHPVRGRSLKSLKPGTHRARIIAKDAAGNRAEQRFTLVVGKARPPCRLVSRSLGQGTPDEAIGDPVLRGRLLMIPVTNLCARFQSVDLRIDGRRQKKHLSVARLDGRPALVTHVPTKGGASVDLRLAGPDGRAQRSFETVVIKPEAEIISGGLHLEVPRKGTFSPYPTIISTTEAPSAPGLRPLSALYRMENALYPSKGWMRIGIARPQDGLGAVGVYLKGKGRWWLLGGRDEDTHTYGASVHLGDIALMRDEADPVIGEARIDPHPAGTRLIIPVSDQGAGISSVEVTVDGAPAFIERQRAFDRIIWLPLQPVKSGPHTVVVHAKDRAGRRSSRRLQITWP